MRPFEESALDCLNDFYSGQRIERSEFLPAEKEREVLEGRGPDVDPDLDGHRME